MPLLPWKYIKEKFYSLNFTPDEIGEKLTYHGLETKVLTKNDNVYLEFDPLPNRLDLLSWWGIIREISIILNCSVKPINFPNIEESKEKPIEVKINSNDCRSFYLGSVRNIKIQESSPVVQEWLKANDINPINNMVDAANLAMLESGQPLHVFDYDSLPVKKEIIVHQAQKGANMTTLQGQKLILDSEDIIISSGEVIIDLAGIIGTQETATNWQTKNILIECASFKSQTIKKTANRLNIFTTASQFFSRESNSFSSPQEVLRRFISLVSRSSEKNGEKGEIFAYKKLEKPKLSVINISLEFIEKKTGQIITNQVIENVWKQLKFSYQKNENVYYVKVPNHRPDIINQEDLLEELLRIYDYNKINGSLPYELNPTRFNLDQFDLKINNLRTYLASCGWQEVITYSLISLTMKEEFESSDQKNSSYQLLVPKNDYHKYYRQTLIASHLKTLNYNLAHGNQNLQFFEISWIYSTNHHEQLIILSGIGKLFNQPFHKLTQEIDFYWIKGVLENVFLSWQLEPEISFFSSTLDYLNSSQSSEIFLGENKIGFLGQIHPQVTEKYQITNPVFMAQISLTKIFAYLSKSPRKNSYRPIAKFPTSEKDLSFILPDNIDYNQVIRKIKEVAGDNLQEIFIFDVYRNPEMAKEGKKSVSFRLVFQSSIKTLTNSEIEQIIKIIKENLENSFGAKLRE